MARSSSIDCLGFHNFGLGLDSIIIKYDESKADKAGEKLSEKNVYAHTTDWKKCTWLALGKFSLELSFFVMTILTFSLSFRYLLFSKPRVSSRERTIVPSKGDKGGSWLH